MFLMREAMSTKEEKDGNIKKDTSLNAFWALRRELLGAADVSRHDNRFFFILSESKAQSVSSIS